MAGTARGWVAVNHLGHPDDIAARDALLDDFTRRRLAMRVSKRSLAKALEVDRNAVTSFEQRRPANPKVSTLVRYSEPLNLRLVLELRGVDVEPPPEATAMLACGYVGAAMLATLVAGRRRSGLTQPQLAAHADGWSWSAVAGVEQEDAEPHLSTLQRYARALDGQLNARWEAL